MYKGKRKSCCQDAILEQRILNFHRLSSSLPLFNFFWYIITMIIMEISTAPCLLKILQPKARTKVIQATTSSHRHTDTPMHTHTHAHAHSHTSSFKNYMPPKYTYQKAEKSNHWSFICTLDLLADSNGELRDITNRLVDRARAYGKEASTEKSEVMTAARTTSAKHQVLA